MRPARRQVSRSLAAHGALEATQRFRVGAFVLVHEGEFQPRLGPGRVLLHQLHEQSACCGRAARAVQFVLPQKLAQVDEWHGSKRAPENGCLIVDENRFDGLQGAVVAYLVEPLDIRGAHGEPGNYFPDG